MSLTLFCKSYRTDLKRAIRLAKSIRRFNIENIPFYLSVPMADVPLFKEHLADLDVEVISDDLIVQHNPRLNLDRIKSLPGSVSQQVIKSEFWRLGLSDVYMCLDSDAVFIRPFYHSDFLWANDLPYTVMDESHELLEASLSSGKPQVVRTFSMKLQTFKTDLIAQARLLPSVLSPCCGTNPFGQALKPNTSPRAG